MKHIVVLAAVMTGFLVGPGWAQASDRSDTTIRGGGIPPVEDMPPETRSPADQTGSIAESGRRKPPGAALGEDGGTNADLERRSREIDRRIRTGICRGC